MPKMNPLMVVLTTIILAVVTAVSVFLLYQNRQTPVAPTAPIPSHASTTQTISDDFQTASTVNWTFPAETTVSNGRLTSTLPTGTVTKYNWVDSNYTVSGDFTAEIDNVSLTVSGATGSGELGFFNTNGDLLGRISRYKSTTTDIVEAQFELTTDTENDPMVIALPVNTGTVKLKLVRLGNTGQAFYDAGSGYQLLTSRFDWTNEDGYFSLYSAQLEPDFPQTTAVFDNFLAAVNITEPPQTTPAPGSAAACALTFTVLDTVPTPTVTPTPPPGATPTPTPTPGPTATPTPGPTATPTPAPTPASCNNTCTVNADCSNGLICSGGQCRNQQCVTSNSCNCVVVTPTPTTPVVTSITPTPVTLQTAGSTSATWILGIGGMIILGLGAILIFAI